ncbi:hypothetical protein C8R46DRAFT_1208160 [Mycena filopes]|nr:hypothetical protein C8R46DRAFT_1208160 [Mycena filopes]
MGECWGQRKVASDPLTPAFLTLLLCIAKMQPAASRAISVDSDAVGRRAPFDITYYFSEEAEAEAEAAEAKDAAVERRAPFDISYYFSDEAEAEAKDAAGKYTFESSSPSN